MSTMTAAVVHQLGAGLTVEDVPVPQPGPGQALVKLISSGVCHTDLHAVQGDWPVKPTPPFIPGHEGVGTVVALGEGVTDLSLGQLVGNAWLWSACGTCQYCRTGWETLCEQQQNGGYSIDGSFGEYMLVDSRFAARIPDGVDLIVEVAPDKNAELDSKVIRNRGSIAVYASTGDPLVLDIRVLMTLNVRYQFQLLYTQGQDVRDAAAADINAAIIDGALPIGDDVGLPLHRFSLAETAEAHAAVEGDIVGKVLIDVGHTGEV